MSGLRAEITAEIVARTGIDEAMIERLVRRFYEAVREDPLLAPIFAARIRDWEPHLQRMFPSFGSTGINVMTEGTVREGT